MRQRTLCLFLLMLSLAACGQKGPLFLPDDARPPASSPASDEEDEEETTAVDERDGG